MLVEARTLIKRITQTCRRAMESATVQAMNARQYEVTVEHVMNAFMEDADSDVAFLVSKYDLDVSS
ncbi:MAG: hypothetical protein AAGA56_31150, partial [Myxococcota bacterium]